VPALGRDSVVRQALLLPAALPQRRHAPHPVIAAEASMSASLASAAS